ncbi:MAG: hypothetical protein QXO71_00510 [Candidatus Jordarchaeaceae archaeon]
MTTVLVWKQLKEELLAIGREISKILDESNVLLEQVRCLIADIDRCYILLDRFEEFCKDFSYYFALRKGLCSSLTPLTIALEAFEAGALNFNLLKNIAEKSNAKSIIEKTIKKLDEKQLEI